MKETEETIGKTSDSSDKKPVSYGRKSFKEKSVSYLN
jgi:hypothetical protein